MNTKESVAILIAQMMEALEGDFPEDGICWHLGITETIRSEGQNLSIGLLTLIPPSGTNLVITVCGDSFKEHENDGQPLEPNEFGEKMAQQIKEAVDSIGTVIDSWNGEATNHTASFILGRRAPEALLNGICNYSKVKNVFNFTAQEKNNDELWEASYQTGLAKARA